MLLCCMFTNSVLIDAHQFYNTILCAISLLCTLALNTLQQICYKEVILTDDISHRCFSEAMKDGCDGWITQTVVVV